MQKVLERSACWTPWANLEEKYRYKFHTFGRKFVVKCGNKKKVRNILDRGMVFDRKTSYIPVEAEN